MRVSVAVLVAFTGLGLAAPTNWDRFSDMINAQVNRGMSSFRQGWGQNAQGRNMNTNRWGSNQAANAPSYTGDDDDDDDVDTDSWTKKFPSVFNGNAFRQNVAATAKQGSKCVATGGGWCTTN
ncbi:hypothetical protein DCS_03818 [Drechmeria coniospora]|uniref:Uncharacterized protein n=1 Tax=Drechmeria coniospora TaxID=98403 RepID=A0A151GIF6_DRECN|nr:hypothetical protein DCS_03818 [Drechmeria coniospora]KYK56812.1 hypothetical protein DCS_03818 [Drechmeria coniospora]